MAKKSTTATAATTDMFIEQQVAPATAPLPTGVKVAIGFSIAASSIVLAWCLYKGIKYIITNNKNGQQQVQPAPANMNMTGIPQINLSDGSPESTSILNTIIQQQAQQQNTVNAIQQMLQQQQAEQQNTVNIIQQQQAQLAQMVNIMNEMSQAIRNHNTDDYNNMSAQLQTERQQREYAESLANHLSGKVSQLEQQVAAYGPQTMGFMQQPMGPYVQPQQ